MGRHEARQAIEARLIGPGDVVGEAVQPTVGTPVEPVVGRGVFEPRRYLRPDNAASEPANQPGRLSRLRNAPYVGFQALANSNP